VRDSNLKDFDYVQVLWSQAPVVQKKIKTIREPEAIKIKPGDTSYPDCGGVNCNSCMTKLIAQFKPLQIGQNAYQCSLEQAPKIDSGWPFVVTIPDGRAWVAPQKNSWVICDAMAVITPDNYLLGDLSRNYPWFLPGCPDQERAEHSIFEQENIAPVEKITGRVALLSSLAGHVYYHWMFDILPRLELLRRSGIKFKEIDWFVVNSLSKPYQQETLNLMGIAQDKIIESDRHSHIQASELIVPSFPGYLDWVPEGTIKFLRETFLPQINSNQNNQNHSKIYVSRARAKNRRLVNEIEVSQLLTKLGFVTVFLEEMSFLEQVKTFANAKMIVSPHGSGLTNLVFCSPHTQVVELFSPNYIRTDYWMISQQLDLQHYYIVGQNFSCSSLRNLMYQNALTEDIFVSIDALKLVLQHC
jgi:capsular polysaccharide biosynthesis protein